MIKKRKVVDGVCISEFACAYCDSTPDQKEVYEAYASGTYVCEDESCAIEYMNEWAYSGTLLEAEEEEYEVCDSCEEEEDTSYDGMCMLCWEDLNEHLEENKNDK